MCSIKNNEELRGAEIRQSSWYMKQVSLNNLYQKGFGIQ